jgi:hypothetical protein
VTCLITRHAARLQFIGSFLDVLSDFFGYFSVALSPPQEVREPIHRIFPTAME